jgi:hypothetical protein
MEVLLESYGLINGTRVKGGENVVSMSKRVGVAVVSIIFLVALVSAVPVDAKKGFSAERWWSEVYWTGVPNWTGDIWTGEKGEGTHGTIYWDNHGAIWLGPEGRLPYPYPSAKVQKFWGVWWIDFGSDGTVDIYGYHDGSFTYAIMQCTINGHVTETSDDWSNFDGRKIHTVNFVDMASGYIEHYLQIN